MPHIGPYSSCNLIGFDVKCPKFDVLLLLTASTLLAEKGWLKIEAFRDVMLTLVADVMFISTTEGETSDI